MGDRCRLAHLVLHMQLIHFLCAARQAHPATLPAGLREQVECLVHVQQGGVGSGRETAAAPFKSPLLPVFRQFRDFALLDLELVSFVFVFRGLLVGFLQGSSFFDFLLFFTFSALRFLFSNSRQLPMPGGPILV